MSIPYNTFVAGLGAAALTGTEEIAVVQSGVSKVATVSAVALLGSAGGNVVPGWLANTINSNFSNYSFLARIPGKLLSNIATTWKFYCNVHTGSMDIGSCHVRTTAIDGTAFLSSTAVTWGGNASPTLAAGRTASDPIAVTLDGTADVFIEMYLPTSANNTALIISVNSETAATSIVWGLTCQWVAGNQVGGASTWVGLTSLGAQNLIDQAVKVS